MNQNILIISVIIAMGSFLLGYFFAKSYFLTSIRRHRTDAIAKSKSVISGNVTEKIAPLLPGFPYKMRDMIFVGKGVDYIVFDGLSSGNLQEIIFLEIKSGSSHQNANERMIENVIKKSKVRYEVTRR